MTNAREISDAAAEWLIRLEAQTSPEVWDAFQQWLDIDLRHRAAFVRLRTAWKHVDLLKNLRPLDGTIDSDLLAKVHLNPALVAARGLQPLEGKPRKRADDEAPGRFGLLQPERRRWLAAAAAAVVVAAGVIGWLGAFRGGWKSYQTDIGGREEVVLQDGSTVELNTNTELRTRIKSSRRDIMLTRGEALFHVAHDTNRPFYVTAGGTVIRAVGTEFSVRIRDAEHVDVLVAEGRVAVGAPGSAINVDNPTLPSAAPKVSAGESASVRRNAISVKRLPSQDVTRKLAWTAGHLAFQGETLDEAVQEFNRYNQRRLTIADPSILQLQVGGIFSATDPDSFVAALERSFGVRTLSAQNNGDIRLIAGGKPP